MDKFAILTPMKRTTLESDRKSEIKVTMPVRTPDKAVERLNYLHGIGMTWRQISNLDDYKPIPPGSLCTFVKTGELADKWRVRLGLPIEGKVRIIFGLVPDGSQVIGAEQCHCNRWYISNHPARHQCFICGPYQGKRRQHAETKA